MELVVAPEQSQSVLVRFRLRVLSADSILMRWVQREVVHDAGPSFLLHLIDRSC